MDKLYTEYLLSVVIIVKNEANRIGRCIESLLFQKEITDCEVLFVDGNSSDNTVDIIGEYVEKYHNFRIIRCERCGYAYQRNIGISNSRGQYVLFISGDTVCDSKLLRKYYVGIGKGYEVMQGTVIQDGEDKAINILYKVYRKTMDNELEDISTVNIAIKKSLFSNHMFDVRNIASEDKLWYLLLEDKSHYSRMRGAIVFHEVHETVHQYAKKIQKEAKGIGTSMMFHPDIWRKHNYFGWLSMTAYQCVTAIAFLFFLLSSLFVTESFWLLGIGFVVAAAFEVYKFFTYKMYKNDLRSIAILELFIFSAQKGMIEGILSGLLMRRKEYE